MTQNPHQRMKLILLHLAKWTAYAVAAVMIGYLIFAIVYAAQGGSAST